jgi:hypothetical protein
MYSRVMSGLGDVDSRSGGTENQKIKKREGQKRKSSHDDGWTTWRQQHPLRPAATVARAQQQMDLRDALNQRRRATAASSTTAVMGGRDDTAKSAICR